MRCTEGYILLNAAKTKTNEARSVPMTARLRGILEMRRTAVSGDDFPATAYVFGNRVGEQTSYAAFKKGWKRAYTKAGISGLHFHDLRRESRRACWKRLVYRFTMLRTGSVTQT